MKSSRDFEGTVTNVIMALGIQMRHMWVIDMTRLHDITAKLQQAYTAASLIDSLFGLSREVKVATESAHE